MSFKIGILMPFKDAAPWIAEAIESILQQDFYDWQLIAVNDHSIDEGPKLLKTYSERDPRISFFENKGEGILPALQLALSHCQAEMVSRFDADDIMPQGRLKKMHDLLEKSAQQTIVTGMVQYFSDRPISKGYQKYQHWLNEVNLNKDQWREIYRECVIASPNWLMRTDELKKMGGFEGLSYPEDYDWCFRFYKARFEIACLHSTTLLWREHPLRTSRNSENYQQDQFFQLKLTRFLELESFEHLVLWGSGRKARITAAFLDRHQISFRWMDMEPQRYPDGIKGHPIEDFRNLSPQAGQKLLIGVYPNPSARRSIEDFLFSRHLQMGEDYWYL